MKIAWFTPFNEKSAIGKYSKLAADAISRYADIDIFTFDKGKNLKTDLEVIQCNIGENLIDRLSEYNIVVYNIGDNLLYHENIYDILQVKRGIIIIHDATLLGFFYGYYSDSRNRSVNFKNLYENLYNDSVENATSRYISSDGIKYGFMEEITKFCSGVIVHSDFHAGLIKKVYNGPLSRIYFPFSQEYLIKENMDEKHVLDHSRLNMLTVGNINKNKRILEVVETIGKSRFLHKELNYTIIGSNGDKEYIEQIEKIIKKYNIKDNIKMIGYVDDATLTAYYGEADVLCNLRNPALEGASWSLVEQMSMDKPIIVSDNGFYSEIPDDCVIKISVDNEEEDLADVLNMIVQDKDMLDQKGRNARKLVDEQFNQEQYAKIFIAFAEKVIFGKPVEALINKLTIAMSQFNITKDMKIVETVSEQMESLFTK